ncbi:MAG: caspase family protein [Phormidesmis sp.]
MPQQPSSQGISSRDIEIASSEFSVQTESPQAEHCNRWAIIVGISKYQDASLNLRYADRDAEALYQLLITSGGGHFQPEFICKLTNKRATTGKITQALRAFLKKPAREDLVLIYFACHGAPDPDRPGNVYLLTHDTDSEDIAGTGLPMGDINRALKDTLLAEKVIILADTCHSAAIGGGIRSRGVDESAALINRYLQDISIAKGGTALLTSAEANEVSFEDEKWGGGHGVFTYYLLRGLKGEADVNCNGFVTVGELFEYVRMQVKEATNHKQHPSIGTNPFDRNLPLAIARSQSHPSMDTLLTSSTLLLSSPTQKKIRLSTRVLGLFLGAALLSLAGLILTDTINWPSTLNPDETDRITNDVNEPSTNQDAYQNAQSQRERSIVIASEKADRFERLAMDQFAVEKLTYNNLNQASDNWQKAIDVMHEVDLAYSLSPFSKESRKQQEYQNRLLYTEALKHGLVAAELIVKAEITSEDCQKVETLWEKAISTLEEIPRTDLHYTKTVDPKIDEYQKNAGYARNLRVVADFRLAVKKATQATEDGQRAVSPDSWLDAAVLWDEALQLMHKVPDEPKANRDIANDRISTYQKNHEIALERASNP